MLRAEAEKVEELGEPGEDKKREKEAGSIPSTAPGAKDNMNQPKVNLIIIVCIEICLCRKKRGLGK